MANHEPGVAKDARESEEPVPAMTARHPGGFFAVLASGMVLFSFGCGGSKSTKVIVPKDGLAAGTPINDTASHLMTRFDATFDAQSNVEYSKLLTDDFRFHFSQACDPDLALAYGENWRRDDEIIAMTHLFAGFTNTSGQAIPGASRIDMTLFGLQVLDDSSHVDSLEYYRRVVATRMVMSVEVPGSPEPTVYSLDAKQGFYIVRGDAAVLGEGQGAQSDRWYIRQWDDLSLPPYLIKRPVVDAAAPTTIGSIKGQYR